MRVLISAEDICLIAADHRLYYSVGYSLIQVVKSLATFEPEDLEAAIQCCKDSIVITSLLRKKDHSVFDNLKGLATGSTSVGSIRSMTVVQRHAELVFAECTLLKVSLFTEHLLELWTHRIFSGCRRDHLFRRFHVVHQGSIKHAQRIFHLSNTQQFRRASRC